MYENEFEMMNGSCPYCGQVIAVKAMDQRDADLKAADKCGCDEAKRAQRFKEAAAYLQQISSGEDCRELGFMELNEKQIQIANLALETVCKYNVSSVQINLEDSVLKITAKAEGKIAIVRGKKVHMRVEV